MLFTEKPEILPVPLLGTGHTVGDTGHMGLALCSRGLQPNPDAAVSLLPSFESEGADPPALPTLMSWFSGKHEANKRCFWAFRSLAALVIDFLY